MKKIFRNAILCGGLLVTITACNSDDSIAPLEVMVKAQATQSRSLIDQAVLPNNSSIGVTLVENTANATDYDDGLYNNLKYTSANGRDWSVVGTNTPMLSSTAAKAIAYFPWKEGANYSSLDVDILSQTDYMYSEWYTGSGNKSLDNSNPQAQFQMKHALSAFRVKLVKDESYKSTAKVTRIDIASGGFNTTAKLNAENGTLSDKKGTGTYTYNFTGTYPELTKAEQYIDVMVIPADNVAADNKVTFTVNIQDGAGNSKDYVVAPSFASKMAQGTIYEFVLTLTPTEMKVGEVSVLTWVTETGGAGNLQPADLNKGN